MFSHSFAWLMAPWGTPAAAPAPPRHWPARHSRGHTPEPTRTGTLRRPGQIPQKPREKCGKIQWKGIWNSMEILSGNVRENGWKFEMVISQEPIFMGGTGSIYFWPIFPAYVREYPNKIWPYMIQYLHLGSRNSHWETDGKSMEKPWEAILETLEHLATCGKAMGKYMEQFQNKVGIPWHFQRGAVGRCFQTTHLQHIPSIKPTGPTGAFSAFMCRWDFHPA